MPPKILIADDDVDILDLIKFTLSAEQYDVIECQDGEDALRRTIEEKPDLVILDVSMPKISGFEVCEKIRENSSTCLTPIILLTSLSKTKDKLTGIKLGADEYLTKPFEPFELVARVEMLLRRIKETISANPLTGLPGNLSIEAEIKKRMESSEAFAMIYTDVNNFKAFNERYGFDKGDSIIRFISVILRKASDNSGDDKSFVGHIGGEDFVIITLPGKVKGICGEIIEKFDRFVPEQYEEDIREKGYIWGQDRAGKEVQFPLMSISIGTVIAEPGKYLHYSQIVEQAKELLQKAKLTKESSFEIG
ncbi:MAG: response regulator [Elusimicrobiota bacterium]